MRGSVPVFDLSRTLSCDCRRSAESAHARNRRQLLFELAAEHGVDAERPQPHALSGAYSPNAQMRADGFSPSRSLR